jgi:DNA topoisomerase III
MCWLDCDREGENICFEVMKNAVESCEWNRGGHGRIKKENVFRAKYSAVDKEAIRKAYKECCDRPNKNESDAVEARQELDLKIGEGMLITMLLGRERSWI